jgi:cell wall-associated NlpC family hydrolase
VKNFLIILLIAPFITSCSNMKPVASSPDTSNASKKQSSITFINNVSIQPESQRYRTGASTASEPTGQYIRPVANKNSFYSPAIENYSPLQFKYAILMDATVEEMDNANLLNFIDTWYGTRYQYGGSSKDGIDCSAFVSSLMSEVYGVGNLPRMSKDQYEASKRVKRTELQEGDLVFFHTMGRKRKSVTHVGMYLRNNKFIHASISGVMISSLDEGYYSQHFVGAGRVL